MEYAAQAPAFTAGARACHGAVGHGEDAGGDCPHLRRIQPRPARERWVRRVLDQALPGVRAGPPADVALVGGGSRGRPADGGETSVVRGGSRARRVPCRLRRPHERRVIGLGRHRPGVSLGRDGQRSGWKCLRRLDVRDPQKSRDAFTFSGKGFGHGVGLCQSGALTRLKAGTSTDDVLEHYFPGTSLRR